MMPQHQQPPSLFPTSADPKTWDHWPQIQSYIHLTQEDIDLIEASKDLLIACKPTIITKTVDALLNEPFIRPIAYRESTRERLEGVVNYYVDSLLAPRIDDDYIATRTHIGQTHIRVKVAPEWVQATCTLASAFANMSTSISSVWAGAPTLPVPSAGHVIRKMRTAATGWCSPPTGPCTWPSTWGATKCA